MTAPSNAAIDTRSSIEILLMVQIMQGSVRVFELDPVKHPVEVLQRIGYLSEERDLPEWMRIDELLRYTAAFHPRWDQSYADELLDKFGLDAAKKVKHLSKGMRAQAGLIAAVAHRPDLLLLDEPTTGLDPIVRRDILNAIIRTVADDGRTAIFSSHLLDEVEQMSDYVFMIDQGKLVLQGRLDGIKQRHQLLNVRFDTVREELPPIDGILSAERQADIWSIVCNGATGQVPDSLRAIGGQVTHSRSASLQETFVARVGRDRLTVSEE
jgi:ABC-2 type transport system ATP-binding protein